MSTTRLEADVALRPKIGLSNPQLDRIFFRVLMLWQQEYPKTTVLLPEPVLSFHQTDYQIDHTPWSENDPGYFDMGFHVLGVTGQTGNSVVPIVLLEGNRLGLITFSEVLPERKEAKDYMLAALNWAKRLLFAANLVNDSIAIHALRGVKFVSPPANVANSIGLRAISLSKFEPAAPLHQVPFKAGDNLSLIFSVKV